MKKRIPEICVLIAGILWGCIGVYQRTMKSAGFEAMEMVTVRSYVTTICMLMFVLIYNKKELRIKLKDIWCFLGTGMMSVVFFNFCYLSCMQYTTLSVAAILLYTAPSFVMVMSFFLFKEKFTVRKVIALVMSFAGCVCVSGGSSSATFGVKGILFGLGAGFGYALYSIFGKYAINRGYKSYTITTYTFLFAAIGGSFLVNPVGVYNKMAAQDMLSILFEVGLIIAVTVLAYIFYTTGLSKLENGKSSIIASIEPVVATIVSVVVYGEGMSLIIFVGILLVLSSIVFIEGK